MACKVIYNGQRYDKDMFRNIYTTVVADDNSYYRAQLEPPVVDPEGNLILKGREDDLYSKQGLPSRGSSFAYDMDLAIDYGLGKLESIGVRALEMMDPKEAEDYLDSYQGYYLIQVSRNIKNKLTKHGEEVKLIGDNIVVPYGKYNFELVNPNDEERGMAEVFYQVDLRSSLQKLGRRYNMNYAGFMSRAINPNELKKDLKKLNLSGVTVATSRQGDYMFRVYGSFYNPYKETYQLRSNKPSDSDVMDRAVETFLNKIGAQVNLVKDLPHGAAGKVNVIDKIISVVEGRKGLDTITEEAAHLMVAMMRGTRSYHNMMKSISNFDIYDKVKQEYKDVKGYGEPDMREEAVVKMVTDLAVKEHMSKEEKTRAKNWWDIIIEAIRGLIRRAREKVGMDPVYEFRKVANKMLRADMTELSDVDLMNKASPDISDQAEFFQVVPNKDVFDARKKQVDEMMSLGIRIEGDRYYIEKLDKWVRFRVSDIVAKLDRELFKRPESTPEKRSFYTTKGTIVHLYAQLIMEHLKKGESFTQKGVASMVYNILKTQPEFENYQNRSYYQLTTAQFQDFKKGVEYVYSEIVGRDEDALIHTEFKVYNPKNDIDSIAGTIDLLVVYSDGTLGMYDYKSMGFWYDYANKTYKKPSDEKRQIFDLQLSEYKKILQEVWALKDSDFRETRIIPINTQFDFSKNLQTQGFKRFEMYHPGAGVSRRGKRDVSYLSHLTVAREYIPEDQSLNEFLDQLYNKREEVREKITHAKGDNRTRLRLRLNKLDTVINTVIVDGNISAAIHDIADTIDYIKNKAGDFSSKLVLHYRDLLKMYSSFNLAFKKSIDVVENKEDKQKLELKVKHYNHEIDVANSILNQRIIDIASDMTDLNLLDGGKVKGFLGQMFDGIVDWNNPVIYTIGTLLAEKRVATRQELLDMEKEIDIAHDEYVKWARRNGYRGINMFKPLIRERDRNLISKFKSSFYDDMREMKQRGREKSLNGEDTSEEVAWFKKHYTFDEEKWKVGYEDFKQLLNDNADLSKKDRERELKKKMMLNPKKNSSAWFEYNNFYIKPKEVTSTDQLQYISDEWKFVAKEGNEAARNYIDMYHKYNDLMSKIVGYDRMGKNFVGNIHANTMEKMGDLGIFEQFTIMSDFRRSLEIRENDTSRGVTGRDGRPLNEIPVIGLDRLKATKLSENERRRIRKEVEEKYDPESIDYLNEVARREEELLYEKGVMDKSKDLTKSLKLMLSSVHDYKYKAEIEDDILLLREVLTLKDYSEIVTDQYNRPMVDKFMNKIKRFLGGSPETISSADKFIKLLLYGQRIQDKRNIIKVGNMSIPADKLLQVAHNFLSIKALGLNPILAGASFIGAKVNMGIVGSKGIYYTNRGMKESIKSYTSANSKDLAAIYYFEPSSRNIAYDKALKKSVSKMRKWSDGRTIFFMHRGTINKPGSKKHGIDNPIFGDDNIDNSILIAMMHHWVVDSDGKIKSKGDPFTTIKDPNAKTIYESFTIEGEQMKVEGLSEKEFTRFKRLMHKAQTAVKGSMTEDQQNISNTMIGGMALNKFRMWMPGLMRERFSKFQYDLTLKTFHQGHFRVFGQELLGVNKRKAVELGVIKAEQELLAADIGTVIKGFGNLVGKFLSIGAELASFGYLHKHKLNPDKAQFYYLKYKNDLGSNVDEDVEFTLENFMEFRKKQFRAMARELRYLVGLVYGVTAIMAAAGWDDDEDNMMAYNAYRLAKRAGLELSFFFSVDSVNEIVKSPFPVFRLLTDLQSALENFVIEAPELIGLTSPNKRDRTPLGHYTLKHLPGINHLLYFNGYFERPHTKTLLEKVFGKSEFFDGYILSR